jgi:hypothetical protein
MRHGRYLSSVGIVRVETWLYVTVLLDLVLMSSLGALIEHGFFPKVDQEEGI